MVTIRSCTVILALALTVTTPAFAGNNTWTISGPMGGNVSGIAYDPVNASIVYAPTNNGIFRSTDNGQTWSSVGGTLGSSFNQIAVANSDPNIVYATATGGLYKSTDRGLTWVVANPLGGYGVAVSRQNPNVLYMTSPVGAFRSSDGGGRFARGNGIPPDVGPYLVAVDPQNDNVAYVGAIPTGVFKSTDGGANWTSASFGLPTDLPLLSMAIDPANGSTLYAGFPGKLYKSINGAASWSSVTVSTGFQAFNGIAIGRSTVAVATNSGVSTSPNGGAGWTKAVQLDNSGASVVAIDPTNAANILAGSPAGVYRSTDGGATFTFASAGLTVAIATAIAVDSQHPSDVYAATPGGVFKSTDRGATWTKIGPVMSTIAVDPFNSSVLYAFSLGLTFMRSTDGGATWQAYTTGLPSVSTSYFVVDPQTPNTLYITTNRGEVYRKSGGDPWTSRSNGLTGGTSLRFLTIDPRNPSTLYTANSTTLFKTVDAGSNWTPINTGAFNGLAVDPFDSNHLLLWTSQALQESTDGGTSWKAFGVAGYVPYFDPSVPGRIYALFGASLYMSTDAGKTWPKFVQPSRSAPSILTISPDGRTLYAGGYYSGSVWTFTFGKRHSASAR